MATFMIQDCDDSMVQIRAEEIGELLSMAYFTEYEGEDNIESFIDWFITGCQDEDDKDED